LLAARETSPCTFSFDLRRRSIPIESPPSFFGLGVGGTASVWAARRLVQVVTAVAFPFPLVNSSFAASVDEFFKSPVEEPAVFFCHTAKFLILEYD
jgi:hypothetical protein